MARIFPINFADITTREEFINGEVVKIINKRTGRQMRGRVNAFELLDNKLRVTVDWIGYQSHDDAIWVKMDWRPERVYEFWTDGHRSSRLMDSFLTPLGALVLASYPYPIGLLPETYYEDTKIDPNDLMTEYHVEVHVKAENNYPNVSRVRKYGMSWHVAYREGAPHPHHRTNADATVTAIVFVKAAPTWNEAVAWCRDECRRLGLHYLSARKTHLIPGC